MKWRVGLEWLKASPPPLSPPQTATWAYHEYIHGAQLPSEGGRGGGLRMA